MALATFSPKVDTHRSAPLIRMIVFILDQSTSMVIVLLLLDHFYDLTFSLAASPFRSDSNFTIITTQVLPSRAFFSVLLLSTHNMYSTTQTPHLP